MNVSALGENLMSQTPRWARGWRGSAFGLVVAAFVYSGALMIAVFIWEPIGEIPLVLVLGSIVVSFPLSIIVATSDTTVRRLGLGAAAGTCLAALLFISWLIVAIAELSINGPA